MNAPFSAVISLTNHGPRDAEGVVVDLLVGQSARDSSLRGGELLPGVERVTGDGVEYDARHYQRHIERVGAIPVLLHANLQLWDPERSVDLQIRVASDDQPDDLREQVFDYIARWEKPQVADACLGAQ